MKKIIISILSLLPIITFGNIKEQNPQGKYWPVETGKVCKVYFLDYDGSETTGEQYGCACVWAESPDHYVFGASFKNNITQLLAIMTENWNVSNVKLSHTHEGFRDDYYFVSLSCSDLGTKMNNDSHFKGWPCNIMSDEGDALWKNEYNISKPV